MPTEQNSPTATSAPQASASDYEERMLEAFVQNPEKLEWYKNAFAKFNINGVDKIAWVWSWWAFFGGVWFLLYRKAYLAALGLFVLTILFSFVPFGGLVLWVLTGGFATYFVYLAYKKKKEEIEAKIDDPEKRIETMRQVGGYNQWVVWVAVILYALMILYAVSVFVAVSGQPPVPSRP